MGWQERLRRLVDCGGTRTGNQPVRLFKAHIIGLQQLPAYVHSDRLPGPKWQALALTGTLNT